MPGEIRKLNALRGIAALVVVVAHFSGATGWLGGYPGKGAGQLGVMVFFVLSGFLMAYLYFERSLDVAGLQRYVVARLARVIPLFAAVVLLSALLPRLGVRGVLYDLATKDIFAAHVLLLLGKSILWTIPTELHFYASFVVFWWLAGRSRLAVVAAAVGVLTWSLVSDTPRIRGELGSLPYDLRLPQVIPYFLSGMLLGMLYRRFEVPRSMQRSAYSLVVLAVPLLYPLVFEKLFGFRHGLWNDPLVLLAVTTIFAVVLFAVPNDALVLANPLGDFLGQISYSLYLLHVPVMWAIGKLDLPDTVRFMLFLVLSIALAATVFRFFERPAQTFLRTRFLGHSR